MESLVKASRFLIQPAIQRVLSDVRRVTRQCLLTVAAVIAGKLIGIRGVRQAEVLVTNKEAGADQLGLAARPCICIIIKIYV